MNSKKYSAIILLLLLGGSFSLTTTSKKIIVNRNMIDLDNSADILFRKENLFSTKSKSSYNPQPAYAPVAKSPVAVNDYLIYSVSQNISGNIWQGEYKYEITSIENILGVIYITGDLYQRNFTESTWGSPINEDLLLGELDLNHVSFNPEILIQHLYFTFLFQGYDDAQNALSLQAEAVSNQYSVSIDSQTETWLDFFTSRATFEVHNSTHSGEVTTTYQDGIILKNQINLVNSDYTDLFYLDLNFEVQLSHLSKKQINYWGEPTENIPVTAEDKIINTDYLVYSVINESSESEPGEQIKYTISSIDPDPYDRKTVITTSVEKYDTSTEQWDTEGSQLLFVDHSSPYQLRKLSEINLILPDNLDFSIDDMKEELEASKYWLENYEEWQLDTYNLNQSMYSLTLTKGSENIVVSAEYAPNMILTTYEFKYTQNSEILEYVKYNIEIYQSKVAAWSNDPPESPVLKRISSQESKNQTIEFEWDPPFYSVDFNVYIAIHEGINTTSVIPEELYFTKIMDKIPQTQIAYQGQHNTTYYFRVTALNPAGTESAFSNILEFKIYPDDSIPRTRSINWGWLIFGILVVIGVGISFWLFKRLKTTEKEETLDFNDYQ